MALEWRTNPRDWLSLFGDDVVTVVLVAGGHALACDALEVLLSLAKC
jgi:hypothetical protein